MARKSKEFGYFLSQQKKSKQKQKQLEILKDKLKESPLHSAEIVLEPTGEVKMSEVLMAFVEPYRQIANTEEAMQKLITLAVMAWNASLVSSEEQQEMVEEFLKVGMPDATEELKAELKEIVNELIDRKKRYFSEYQRVIIDFELKDIGREYHLSVSSTFNEASS